MLLCSKDSDLSKVKADLEVYGFKILEIPGGGIKDDQSFFKIAKTVLPLSPPISGEVNWDALSDSLWEGLADLGALRVAILWTHVDHMLDHGLQDLLIAADTLFLVARQLADPQNGLSTPIKCLIVLCGNGSNFKEWDARALSRY